MDAQRTFDDLYGYNYDNNVQYRLTRFGNEISIVFQNFKADRNILFTGDFGKKMNWSFIEKNRDGLVKLHSCYDVIKIPHHGTDSYYHSFLKRIQATSELMIPNGYIAELRLRVENENVILGGERDLHDFFLGAHALAGAGHAQTEAVAVE